MIPRSPSLERVEATLVVFQRSGLFQKYANELFAHRKDAKVAEKIVFCSGGERPPEQKPQPLRG